MRASKSWAWRVGAAAFWAGALLPGAAGADGLPDCQARSTGFGSGELRCQAPAGPARQLVFEMAFAGVHDDSQAALAVSQDGRPLQCAQGSLPRIVGDEAGATLTCKLELAAAGEARQLLVQLLWFHAEPNGFDWLAD